MAETVHVLTQQTVPLIPTRACCDVHYYTLVMERRHADSHRRAPNRLQLEHPHPSRPRARALS